MPEASKYFLSYASEDADFALKLARDLRGAGVDIWVDRLDITAGHWDKTIWQALRASDALIAVLSPSAVLSDNVMDEVHHALQARKLVLPVLLLDCEIPYRLDRLHRVDFTADYERAFSRLADLLDADPSVNEAPDSPAKPQRPPWEKVARQVAEEQAEVDQPQAPASSLNVAYNSQSSALRELVARATDEDLKAVFPLLIAKLYGGHSADAQSLFQSVQSAFGAYYLATNVFVASQRKVVQLLHADDQSWIWHEVDSYQIRCVPGETELPRIYHVRVDSYASVGAIQSKSEFPCDDYTVTVDNEVVFDLRKSLKVINGEIKSLNDKLRLSYDGSGLRFSFEQDVLLTRETTAIVREEKSRASKSERTFRWTSNVPVYGAQLLFTLPEDYEIEDRVFGNETSWLVQTGRNNRLIASTDAWIYPGVVVHLRWGPK